MKWQIENKNSFPYLKFELNEGECLKSQPGSLLAMSGNLDIKGKADGGIMKSIGRMFSGESFFMQNIEANKGKGWVSLSTPVPGDIIEIELERGKELFVQKDGFLVGTKDIDIATKMQGIIKGLVSGEGLFIAKISGQGTVFLETYGSSIEIEVKDGEEIIVDNGNIVAWESSLDYEITKATSGWISAIITGSGFVCKFKGNGKVWTQSCNLKNLAGSLYPLFPKNAFIAPDKKG